MSIGMGISLQPRQDDSPRLDAAEQSSKCQYFPEVDDLPQVRWSRHTSPLSGSFRLSDQPEWVSSRNLVPQTEHNSAGTVRVRKGNYVDKLLCILHSFGWLRKEGYVGCIPAMGMAIMTFAFDTVIVSLSILRPIFRPTRIVGLSLLQDIDSISRHGTTMASHIGMFCFGGHGLSNALRIPDYTLPILHVVILALLYVLKFSLDLTVFFTRFTRGDGGWTMYVGITRRAFIMLERVPCSVLQMVMMAWPKRLCQDLVRVVLAIEEGNVKEATRLYSVFWKHLRQARRWYDAAMTPQFVQTVICIPILVKLFFFDYGGVKNVPGAQGTDFGIEGFCSVSYAAIDILQLATWIKPAIDIRRNHGVAISAVMEKVGQGSDEALELATLMGSVHPRVGLKFVGFVVTWRLVGQVATIAAIVFSILDYYIGHLQAIAPNS